MAPRCPKGSRRNKKTGNCEKKKLSTKKRCPKGSRRNKKTGLCDSTATVAASVKRSSDKQRNAAFHDISEKITSGYQYAPISREKGKTLQNRVEAFLLSHPTIQYGDIIFVGSTSDRQEYGFQIVLDKGKTLTGEDGSSLPLQRSIRDELKRRGIHYRSLLEKMNQSSDDYEEIMKMYFFGDYDTAFEECIDLYQENDLL